MLRPRPSKSRRDSFGSASLPGGAGGRSFECKVTRRPTRRMRLLAVNVGRPRTIKWRGREVRSAIWKEPVAGRRHVDRLNIDGDDQADRLGHGGEHRAVFVYQAESYRYWEAQLGRELAGSGRFGENFTVAGLPDDEVCIGDRYRIGSALFEVTQPRVMCFKVGIRLDEPRMPALLTGHGRPGFYLRVLEPGEVGAGDAIDKIAGGRHGLSEGWKGSFRLLLEQAERGGAGNSGLMPAGDPPAWPGFRPFRVAEVVRETDAVRSFLLEPEDGEPLAPHVPGQFVALRLRDEAAVVRSYSLSAPADGRRLRISVKREGAASALLHDRVGAGDVLDVGAPRGDFVLGTGDDPVLLVSAGIGVTPVLAMLAGLAENGGARPVTWVHVARSGAEHALAAEARPLLARLPGARSHVRFTRPGAGDRLGADFDGG